MTTSRQWNIINNSEFTRIARDLNCWIQFETNGNALLLSTAEEVKKENLAKAPAKSAPASTSSWWPSFYRSPAVAKTDAPAKPELDIFIDKLRSLDQYDILNRLTVLAEFLERDKGDKQSDSSKFLAQVSKKHPSYDAEQEFSDKVLVGVKASLIAELKKAIGLTRLIPAPPPLPSAEVLARTTKSTPNDKGYFLQLMYDVKPEDKAIRAFTIYLYFTHSKLEYAVKNAEGMIERISLNNELGELTYGIKEVLKDKNQQKKLSLEQSQAIFESTSKRGYKSLSKETSSGVNFALGSDAIKQELEKKWKVREDKLAKIEADKEKLYEAEVDRLGNIELPDISKDLFKEEVGRLSRMKI